ncbi:hypothetical protein HPB48_024364 [Haemaphysalis longicornis]|uniref:Uncharacterized protein n=1 Tax=Haemaphysalis longicornis TaxID=44386 RepID=A0A9J6GXW7_HAELO|nr:hypothetical protein HPB48_024364 [Haemaphysalis longicornis]
MLYILAVAYVSVSSRYVFLLFPPFGVTDTIALAVDMRTRAYRCGMADSSQEKWQSRIGYCFQIDGLLDTLNAYEFLYLIGRLRGIADEDLRTIVDSLISLTDLTEYANRRCGSYSGRCGTGQDLQGRRQGQEVVQKHHRAHLSQWQSRIGYCFQIDGLLDTLNAYEFLYLIGRLRGIADEDLRTIVDSLISLTDLTEYANRRCGSYRCALRNLKETSH